MSELGPFSRRNVINRLDKRTHAARLMKRVKKELHAHLGNRELNVIEKAIIERCAWFTLHIALADAKVAAGQEMSEITARTYQGWANSLMKALMRLGIDKPPPTEAPQSELAQYIAAKSEVAAEK